jgi:hypothetical protein
MILELARYPSWSELVPIVCAGPTGSFRSSSPAPAPRRAFFCGYGRFRQRLVLACLRAPAPRAADPLRQAISTCGWFATGQFSDVRLQAHLRRFSILETSVGPSEPEGQGAGGSPVGPVDEGAPPSPRRRNWPPTQARRTRGSVPAGGEIASPGRRAAAGADGTSLSASPRTAPRSTCAACCAAYTAERP